MGNPKADRFDVMLRDWKKLLPQFRDKFSRSNCPLTAQAVWNYFEKGKVVPAPALLQGSTTMVECGDPVPVEVGAIRGLLKPKGHGAHAVVTANPGGPKEHSAVAVNIRGVIYLVDAYNTPGVVTQDLEGHLSYAKKLEITFNAKIHMVPTDQASKFKCPRH
jgi:hypothetical protein